MTCENERLTSAAQLDLWYELGDQLTNNMGWDLQRQFAAVPFDLWYQLVNQLNDNIKCNPLRQLTYYTIWPVMGVSKSIEWQYGVWSVETTHLLHIPTCDGLIEWQCRVWSVKTIHLDLWPACWQKCWAVHEITSTTTKVWPLRPDFCCCKNWSIRQAEENYRHHRIVLWWQVEQFLVVEAPTS